MRFRLIFINLLLSLVGYGGLSGADDGINWLPTSVWMSEASVNLGYGYRENVLLSENNGQDSAFTFLEADMAVVRYNDITESELQFMIFGESLIFSDIAEFDDETFATALLEYSRPFERIGKLGLGLESSYFKQAFDASLDIDDEISEVVESSTSKVYLKWKDIYNGYKVQLAPGGGRTGFVGAENDYDFIELRFRLEKKLSENWKAKLRYRFYDRSYIDQTVRDADGVSVEGVVREIDGRVGSLSLERSFEMSDIAGKAILEGGLSEKRDNYVGYSDRDQWRAKARLRLSGNRWKFGAGVGYSERYYPVKEVEDGSNRIDGQFDWNLEIERNIGEKWSVFLMLNGESEDSNEELSSYHSRSAIIGIRLPSLDM